ncbi:MAG: hypothetical protein EZS28_031869 [Streblomastix strix]|uniref:Uncharacterized protein n=1 Tax=Streblomastix strix TaxID=222440 RepID=A0A5J4UQZ5_9EUKA|nr:MAG: hypothetical protein EZS28_031869 [Streblomastix strix]
MKQFEELARQTHFRGYYLLNADIINLASSDTGDFAFSAESGTVWMYESSWYDSGQLVPDQVTPASDELPLVDGTASAGISTSYSRGDHVHPINVTTSVPISDSASGSVGTANSYARSDHSHPINISATTPLQDSTGSVGTANSYARSDHQHTINVETNASNIPQVDGVGVNGSSTYYSRHDHVHPQQLTYDGNVTATKFIKTGYYNASIDFTLQCRWGFGKISACMIYAASGMQLLRYNYKPCINTNETIDNPIILYYGTGTSKTADLWCRLCIYCYNGQIQQTMTSFNTPQHITDILTSEPVASLPTDYDDSQELLPNLQSNTFTINNATLKQNGLLQVNTSGNNYNEGIRISRSTNSNFSGIYLGCNPNSTTGTLADQWNIIVTDTGELKIGLGTQVTLANKGLVISADGNILTFNGSVIAGTGASTGASNGSVQYSAGNPILWGMNSTGTEGGFYSNRTNICWRARPVTLGSVPP